jgi:hypothetical protein
MKRNEMEENKFDQDMTIQTPVKALIEFIRHILFLKNVYRIYLFSKACRYFQDKSSDVLY